MPIHNSMDALAAAALSFGNDQGPRLVKLAYFAYCFIFEEIVLDFDMFFGFPCSGASS